MTAMRVKVHVGAEPAAGLPAMVGYSIAGHVVIFLVIVLAPHLAPAGPPPPRILSGEIVSLPPPTGTPTGSPEAAARPQPDAPPKEASAPAKPKEIPAPKPPKVSAPPPKRSREIIPVEPDKPKPPKKEEITKPAKGSQDDGEDRGAAKPSAAAPATAGPIAEGVGLAAPAGDASGVPSLNSEAFPYDWYRATIVNLIRSRWRRPVTPGLTQPLRCSVAFVISKSGALSDIAVAATSGFATLDLSALRAVTEASPLPQLPYQYTSESVRGELVFELTPD
ncbi:MAG: TonB family protein [Acidobacteria bacterium]|nr:TonB family protein [Acidobacteriota bacterium]